MHSNPYNLDVKRVRRAFDRSAARYDEVAVLQRTVTDRLLESFDLIDTDPGMILDLGSGTGYGARSLRKRFKRASICQLDLSVAMLSLARQAAPRFFSKERFVCADACQVPFSDHSFDMIFSSFMLQWCSDLDRALAELSRVLKPGGLFIFATMGPDSLKELRESWRAVDENVHVNTFIDMHDVGDAMIRQGLNEPVLSVEHITLMYQDARKLMRELKAIGAQNINTGRRQTLTGKKRFEKVLAQYELYRIDDRLPATYEVIYGHGWKSATAGRQAQDNGVQTVTLEALRQSLKNKAKKD